ncbi:hypothetical protein HN419_07340 [Candidatus Woesearchaeota archaeon]|jgi:sugar-specific transcriptional regulator TrmB|nr:hypothetical protein [Candidatus Woesearchaeota archaeon]MBT3538307.1 hypothetical protein [Candidatus Woesearchaeota archaeon]MBT4696699.1 hypothetical protein [Candidatus Woesearchaeota archaeon]MBT4716817.1 hypothetical protein [Candidatus Woesearchaeota archaeon]MBT7105976.1 hypothetical protein [Candidatus Woesearchaeota archaeon]
MDLLTPLKDIGLTDNEIKVYLTLLKIGTSTASSISERSGMYRPYVYDTLEKLQEKSLVSYVHKNNKKFFSATHPDRLLELQQIKEESISNILPELVSFTKLPREETKVELYKGKEVIKIQFREALKCLKEGGDSFIIGAEEKNYEKRDPIAFEKYFNDLKRYGFKEKAIVEEGTTYLPGPTETTEYRFVAKEFFNPNPTSILNDKVIMIIWGTPDYLIIIHSKQMADAYRKQFKLLWEIAKTKEEVERDNETTQPSS